MPAASANTLSAFNPEYWTATMQETFLKKSTALAVANVELREDLMDGDTLHKPFGSYPRVQTYTSGTDIVVNDISATDDTLVVNTAEVASFYVDDIDKVQNKWATAAEFAQIAQGQLNNSLDQAVINEYTQANTTLDAGDVGGSSGSALVLSASNVSNVFIAAGRTLNNAFRHSDDRFALIGPRFLETVQQYVGARETGFGEQVGDNGKVGRRFGFDLILSNNLPFTATLDGSTIFADNETVVIAGVTLTAAPDNDAQSAGEWSIQASAALCIAQLASLINDDGSPGQDTYRALSAEDRQTLESHNVTATISGTNLLLTANGDIVVAETSATSAWTVQLQYALMGIKGSIDLVTQVRPNVVFRDAQLRLGKYVHPWMLYGQTTFERMRSNLVAVQMNVSAWA